MARPLKSALVATCLIALGACGGGGGSSATVNHAPMAVADATTGVLTGTLVTLDASRSSDDDGDALSYRWTLVAKPAASAAVLGNASALHPTFVADVTGSYTVRLIVNDGHVDSAPALLLIDATAAGAPPGYRLVWADEFDVDGLPDPTRWDYDTDHNAGGWFNHELQYYARDRLENARVSGGRLIITARKEALSTRADWGGQQYSSARLVTRGKASWTYGFVEVRAKLPCGSGTWPAIWTLGTGGTWPNDGEIDIMEQVGSDPTRIFGTLHTLQSGGAGTGGATRVADACTAFHDYQLTWTPDEIQIGLDGLSYYRATKPAGGYSAWPFDFPQYLLLNIAIGGDLGGAVDNTIFPVTLEIEHVRVFQKP